MDGQHTAMIIAASVLPKEELIKLLEDSVSNWKEAKLLAKSDEDIENAFSRVGFICHLIQLNIVSDSSIDGAVKTIDRMEEISKAHNFFKKQPN